MIPGVVASHSSEFLPVLKNFRSAGTILQTTRSFLRINFFGYIQELGLYFICGGLNSAGEEFSTWGTPAQVAWSTDSISWTTQSVTPFIDYSMGSGKGGGVETLAPRTIVHKDGVFLVADDTRGALARSTGTTHPTSWTLVPGFEVYDSNRSNNFLLADNEKFYINDGFDYKESTDGLAWTTSVNQLGITAPSGINNVNIAEKFGYKVFQEDSSSAGSSSRFPSLGAPAAVGKGLSISRSVNNTVLNENNNDVVLNFSFSRIKFVDKQGSEYFIGQAGSQFFYSTNGINWSQNKNLNASTFPIATGDIKWFYANGVFLFHHTESTVGSFFSRNPLQIR
jgi:hypothetical protein